MIDKSKIYIFLDDEAQPIAEMLSPISFELDTRKLTDGPHVLKIMSKDPTGKEGLRNIPFDVRNGPNISIEGINENAIVDGIVPIMVNAYSKGDQNIFLIEGSETPQSIPWWVWIALIGFAAWAMYYFASYFSLTV